MKAHKRDPRDILFVSAQVLLFCTYLLPYGKAAFVIPIPIRYASLAVAAVGLCIVASALFSLRRNLTPFPSPRPESELIISGLYKYIRHPIYSGIILFTAAYGLYSGSVLRLAIALLLFILFIFKARYEEGMLRAKFPGYAEYIGRTGMFFPGVG